MKLFLILLMVALAHGHLAPLIKMQEKINNRYIIVLEDDVDTDVFARGFEVDAGKLGERPLLRGILSVAIRSIAADLSPVSLQLARSMTGVKYVEEDAVAHLDATASWGTDRVNQQNLPIDGDDKMPTGKGANVYIIDSGIRYTHTDFGGRAYFGADFIGDGRNGADCDGHGSHCAGTAVGLRYGVAKEANVYAVRVFDCYGSGSTSSVNSALEFVMNERLGGKQHVVASMSLSVSGISPSMTAAAKNAINAGVVVVTSSGNGNTDACTLTPGYIPEVITVGNTQSDDTIRPSSNYGSCVDILAPGTNIVSCSYLGDNLSATMTGTSMACPHVAGAAAVLMANKGVAPSQVHATLVNQSTPNKIGGDLKTGTPNQLLYVAPQ